MRIAIIITYFGKWPDWIELFLFSCAKNAEIDWYIFTDCEIPSSSSNIHFESVSFDNYCMKVGKKLNLSFFPASPYKLCDLKPFYGYLHEDLIRVYDFWGFGDIDVIWGNIKKFYTDEMLLKYDVLSTHADRLSGHLTILRNTDYFRNLCFSIENWREKLEDQTDFLLDEAALSWLIYPQAKYINKLYSKVIRKILNWRDAWVFYYSILPIVDTIFLNKLRKLYFKEQHTTPILSDDGLTCKHDADVWFYCNGQITNDKTSNEYIYLHFMIFKKNSIRKNYFWKENFYNLPNRPSINDIVVIDKSGIYLKK